MYHNTEVHELVIALRMLGQSRLNLARTSLKLTIEVPQRVRRRYRVSTTLAPVDTVLNRSESDHSLGTGPDESARDSQSVLGKSNLAFRGIDRSPNRCSWRYAAIV